MILLLWPAEGQAQYVGVAKCRPCHMPQYKSGQETRMAKAFELLKPGVGAEAKRAQNLDPDKDYTHDPKCVACHVTGFGQPGGFVSVEETPKLAGVQCEACHGPGKGYLKPKLMSLQNKEYKRADLVAAGMVVPSAQVCQGCHNKNNPFHKTFDYESGKTESTHKHLPLKFDHD